MIVSFHGRETEKIFKREYSSIIPQQLLKIAYRKLKVLHAAINLKDLYVPPGNRLEKLKGKNNEEYSIRINDQYRICFEWKQNQAHDVEIIDYH